MTEDTPKTVQGVTTVVQKTGVNTPTPAETEERVLAAIQNLTDLLADVQAGKIEFIEPPLVRRRKLRVVKGGKFIRDEPNKNNVSSSPASSGPDAKQRLVPKDINHKTLAAYVAQLEATDPDFVAELKAARTARNAFGKAVGLFVELPTSAPRLWADRQDDDPPTPSNFIRKYYKDYLPHTLAKQDLRTLDPALYVKYAQWVGPGRHPDDKVIFAPKRPRSDRLDDAEFGRRVRASIDASKEKADARMAKALRPR